MAEVYAVHQIAFGSVRLGIGVSNQWSGKGPLT